MPLTRYQVRNEYSLADPELYRAADRDDPEALLEGVAMAGLIGVLRQLGDLAEFAAEIFHDLHEEVLATASRGHGLMVRVQQLEVELPLVEKALLSQTNHLSFFSNPGVDWHPNMRSQQNLIARGDLPRFIMDSYEECRGPPRLFLLDKFDVAGAGACLKRYTDPSFFREEASIDDVQRERKVRRVKKKGMRGRNGETPEVWPASHAKLQQLFMEETIANSYNNPARLVKLKRRQFNEHPFCSRNGKSYMEKFVETPSPESKTVHEVSIAPSTLRWTRDCESLNEVVDVNLVSPEKNFSKQKGSNLTSIKEALLPEPSLEPLDGMVVNGKDMEDPEPPHDNETYEIPTFYETEKKELVDAEAKMDRGMDVCYSDEITSEVENYVDALATMESEAETDNEYRAKNDEGFLNDEKNETDSDLNEEHLELQAQYSDSQSLGYSASEDGNTSLIKGGSSFTYSDSQSNLVENIASDGEGVARAFLSTETSASHHVNMTYNQLPAHGGTREIEDSHESVVPKHMGTGDEEISDLGEASIHLCPTGMNAKLSPSAHAESLQVESEAGGYQKQLEVDSARAVFPDSASQNQDGALSSIDSESSPIFQSVDADPKVSSDVLVHSLPVLKLPHEHESYVTYKQEELDDGYKGADLSARGQSLQVESEAEGSDQKVSEVDRTRTVFSDSTSQNQDGALSPIASESNSIFQSVDANPKVSSDVLMHSSTALELPREHESNITYKHEEWDDDYEGADHTENVTNSKITSWHADMMFLEDRFQFPVMPEVSGYSDLQYLSENSVSSPECNPDMENLHDTNSEVHPLAVGLVDLENPDVIEDAQQTHIIKQQSFDFTYDAPLHEQNALVNVELLQEDKFGKKEPSQDFDDVVKVSWTTEAVKGDAGPLNFPCTSSILNDNTSMHDVGTERAPTEQLLLPTVVIVTNDDNATSSLDPTADRVRGSCADSEDPLPDIDNLPQKICKSDEEVSPECNEESNLLEEARDTKASYAENYSMPSDLISHPKSAVESEMPGSSFTEKLLGRHLSNDGTIGSRYAELGTEELAPKPSSQDHLRCSSDDTLSSLQIYLQVDQEEILERLLDVPRHELDLNLSRKDEVSHWMFNPRSETMQSADLVVQENILSSRPGYPFKCPLGYQNDISDAERLQSDETRKQSSTLPSGQLQLSDSLGKERYAAFESCPEDEPTQQSISESFKKSASQEVDCISTTGASLHTNNATSSQSFVMAEINQEDDAPLPPEWTMGKDHQVPLASQVEVFQDGQDSFQLLQQLQVEQKPQLQLSASEGGLMLHNHTLHNVENEKSHTEEQEDEVKPSPLSSLTHVPDGNSVIQDNSFVMEATEQPDHFSTSMPEHAFLDLGRGAVQSNSNGVPPHPFVEDGPSGNDPVSSQEDTQHIKLALFASKDKAQQNFHEKPEAQHESSLNASGPSELKQVEHVQHDLHNLDGERALEATSALPENEVVQANGKSISNIPRPPKRLIEAVAAHDRSMLRKVTERIKSPIEPKANERDSLLEQIRTKSFNLKPAVVTRPSVQGPKTNLKVNAILEKANAIRQAFAGSDEDDDDDNWSDS